MSDDIISKNGEVVGEWDGESVEDLKKVLLKIKQDLRKVVLGGLRDEK